MKKKQDVIFDVLIKSKILERLDLSDLFCLDLICFDS